MRAAIYALLNGDATLMATLTGGLHQAVEVGEIDRQTTPAAFDANGEIKPCALLKFSDQAHIPPYTHGARLIVSLYFYEAKGAQNIDAALARAYVLLHEQKVTPAVGACWEIRHADDVLDARDDALNCSLAISRYQATIRRA